jgi:hypothetical protein
MSFSLELFLQESAYFFVRKDFAAIKLIKAVLHLFAKPHVVLQVMFDKLLHVLVCVAGNVRGRAVQLRAQFRREVHFHNNSVENWSAVSRHRRAEPVRIASSPPLCLPARGARARFA